MNIGILIGIVAHSLMAQDPLHSNTTIQDYHDDDGGKRNGGKRHSSGSTAVYDDDDYHATKYLESIGVTPTVGRKMMLIQQWQYHGSNSHHHRIRLQEGGGGGGRNNNSMIESSPLNHSKGSREESYSHRTTPVGSSPAIVVDEASSIPPLLMSHASPSSILPPSVWIHHHHTTTTKIVSECFSKEGDKDPNKEGSHDGNNEVTFPIGHGILHELEYLRQQQGGRSTVYHAADDAIQLPETTPHLHHSHDGDDEAGPMRHTTTDNDDDDAEVHRLASRFIWPFAYFGDPSASASGHDRLVRQEYVWGRYSGSSTDMMITMEGDIDPIVLNNIVRSKSIDITIPTIQDFIMNYVANTYPIQLLLDARNTRLPHIDDKEAPIRPVSQFHRICKECKLPRLAGLLAHLAYWLMFGTTTTTACSGSNTNSSGYYHHSTTTREDELYHHATLPKPHRHRLVMTILQLWSQMVSTLPKICSSNNRGHCSRGASYWLPRCILLLKVCVRWIILEHEYPDLLRSCSKIEGKVDVRINAMFKQLFDPDLSLSRFPCLERSPPNRIQFHKDMIRMAEEADIKEASSSSHRGSSKVIITLHRSLSSPTLRRQIHHHHRRRHRPRSSVHRNSHILR